MHEGMETELQALEITTVERQLCMQTVRHALATFHTSNTHTHNFIHLLKRQHNYMQTNESENLTNQQHKTLKRYLAQSTQ